MAAHEFAELPIGGANGFDPVGINTLSPDGAKDEFDAFAAGEVPGGTQWIRLGDKPDDAPGKGPIQAKSTSQVHRANAPDPGQTQHVDQSRLGSAQVTGSGVAETVIDQIVSCRVVLAHDAGGSVARLLNKNLYKSHQRDSIFLK